MPDDTKYLLINPIANLFAGILSGYALEKGGILYSKINGSIIAGFPVVVGSLEYIVKKYFKNQDYADGWLISSSSILGIPFFAYGDAIGRNLSKLI